MIDKDACRRYIYYRKNLSKLNCYWTLQCRPPTRGKNPCCRLCGADSVDCDVVNKNAVFLFKCLYYVEQ